MAQENIASVTPLFFESIGARRLCVGTVKFPKKYKTEGCVISETQLKELGLTSGLVDCGWIVSSGKAAKNVEQGLVQLTITNPSATPEPKAEAQIVAIQAYESITTALNKELAAESTKLEEGIVTVVLIGR
jgi:hypothetical protein